MAGRLENMFSPAGLFVATPFKPLTLALALLPPVYGKKPTAFSAFVPIEAGGVASPNAWQAVQLLSL